MGWYWNSTCGGRGNVTEAELSRDAAAALADSVDGWPADVPIDAPGVLDWFAEMFRPDDGTEARYWIGGRHNVYGYPECLETPYSCWHWWWSHESANYGVYWIPEDYCGDPWYCPGCVSGGWLALQPDDGGADCVEDGEEQRMEFVFNRGGNADSNGFADAAESELRRALIVRPAGTVPSAAVPVSAWEFRYAGARRRYLTRQLDPVTLDPMADGDVWSDYLGNSIWGDYTVDDGTATMTTRYVPGLWQTDLTPLGDEPPGVPTTAFVHTNMLGTTRMLSSGAGAALPDASRLYTAFGVPAVEPASPVTRYGYAGVWGYQSNSALSTQNSGLLHLGARYYDPRIGRFLQRDSIGINGGLNVYAYVGNNPLRYVDPSGLWSEGSSDLEVIIDPWDRYPGWGDTLEVREGVRKGMITGGAIGGGVVAGSVVVAAAGPGVAAVCSRALPWAQRTGRSFLRWLNRGKLRIGRTGPKNGKYYFGIRWKNKHLWDLFEL